MHSSWVRGSLLRALFVTSSSLVFLSSCADVPLLDEQEAEADTLGLQAGGSVEDAVRSSCGTASVRGLSEQLVAQMNCNRQGFLVPISHGRARAEQTAYLQAPAAQALAAAIDARPGATMIINSAFRTVAQQYLLYRWGSERRCNIQTVAVPGGSNHESGLAIDIEDSAGWRGALTGRGFRWYGSGDPMHYDFVAGGSDLRRLSVLAFQQLWNLNNGGDRIAEDGAYGAATEARLRRAPAGGFPIPASCGGVATSGCTRQEEENCARFGTQCVDHQCSGGFGPGTGCTRQEEENCARFGTQCVDHQCSGGFGPGTGCTAREEQNCAAFGTQCVDHQCSGGFGPGTGCTAREEQNCASVGTFCVDHQCSGGFAPGTGCTAKEQNDCSNRGQNCHGHACVAR